MKRGRTSKFSNECIALAMELRTEGIRWRNIERGIGKGIFQAVRDAKINGMHKK